VDVALLPSLPPAFLPSSFVIIINHLSEICPFQSLKLIAPSRTIGIVANSKKKIQ
jgi:hypothetical protein